MALAPSWPLETQRLVLRPLEERDFDAFAAVNADPEVARWLYNEPRTRAEAREHFERKRRPVLEREDDWLSCAAIDRESGAFVGDFSFHWVSETHRTGEIGFVVAPEHHGKGYATEAARALLDWAFGAGGFHRVIGRTEARNTASARVLEKLGMRLE